MKSKKKNKKRSRKSDRATTTKNECLVKVCNSFCHTFASKGAQNKRSDSGRRPCEALFHVGPKDCKKSLWHNVKRGAKPNMIQVMRDEEEKKHHATHEERMNLWFVMSSFSIRMRRKDHLSFQLESFLFWSFAPVVMANWTNVPFICHNNPGYCKMRRRKSS